MPCIRTGCSGEELSEDITLCGACWEKVPKSERDWFPQVSTRAKELMIERFMYQYLGADHMDRFKELPMCECCEEDHVEAVGFKWCRPCIELYKQVHKKRR